MATQSSYDEVPYESVAFPQTHPDRLATIAKLLGMKPAPVERCRVLELGCGMGDNLIPMAVSLPESTFLGIDLSVRQIEAGRDVSKSLALTNIDLRQIDLIEFPTDAGTFDYIICHGVYSWVPAAVRERIRDMVYYHSLQFREPNVRVQQARNLLSFLAKSLASSTNPYSLLLQSELDKMKQSRDSYLFHEHLEDVNDPVYFHQFVEHAERHGLKYLGEADLSLMLPANFPPDVASVLQMLSPDLVHLEQYMDFLRNRAFRQTLLCHAGIPVNYELRADRLDSLHAASPAKAVSTNPDVTSNDYETFRSPTGAQISLNHPLTKAGMLCLSDAWPACIRVTELRRLARSRLNWDFEDTKEAIAQDLHTLGKWLLSSYTSAVAGLVELHAVDSSFTTAVTDRPMASPLARHQATRGRQVTNLRHETVVLNDLQGELVRRLDGNRTQSQLLSELHELAES